MPAVEAFSQADEMPFEKALSGPQQAYSNVRDAGTNTMSELAPQEQEGTPGKQPVHLSGTGSSSELPLEEDTLSLLGEKVPNVVGKSIASAGTFALNEKESLRPDDSASIAAAAAAADDDEQQQQGQSTTVLDSSSGSNEDVRAFREQLNEISAIDPLRRSTVTGLHQDGAAVAGVLYVPPSEIPLAGILQHTDPFETPPDYKLIEALDNPRDRIWVLKLEQDVIDFVKDTKETSLVLPQCNSFYRMLAHKIADYYMLGHSVDDSSTAVRLFKTTHCRIVRPLTGVVTPSTAASTPPPLNVHMKILRRGIDVSGPAIANGSNVPNRSVSESGEDDDKKALTREEREAKYEAARLRIMGSAKPVESDLMSEKDESRSSSVSRKGRKSRRDTSDDDFDSRSTYNSYFQPGFPQTGYAQQYMAAQPPVQPPGYAQYGAQMQSPQYWYPQSVQAAEPTSWPQAQSPGLDLPREFDRSMSFQPQPATYSAPQSPYGQTSFQGQYISQYGWPQSTPGNINPMQPFSDRPASSGSQHQQAYAYGRLPSQALGRPPNALEHPLPGSYKSRHFNPQSQTFIPSHGDTFRPFMPQRALSNSDLSLSMPPGSPGLQRQMSQHSQESQFSSPSRSHGAIIARHPPQGMTHPLPPPVFTQQAPLSSTLPPKPNDGTAMSGLPSIGNSSTIAKWETPASLPSKPPPSSEKHAATQGRGGIADSPGRGVLRVGSSLSASGE